MTTPFTPAGTGRVLGGAVGSFADQHVLLTPAQLAAAARCMYTRIDSFTGEYKFLSLDYPCLVFFQGRFFPSARHALLAARYPKAVDELSIIEDIKTLKKVAKEKEEDPDWMRLRLKWLEHIQRDKFRRHADLREKLRNTGGRELVWLNNGDSFFGQVGNRGQNHLGRILMEIRTNINEDTELESWIVICHDIETDERSVPILKLLERKEGETQVTEIVLKGKSFYRLGKLPDNDLVALNPSISRRHAALVVLKGGSILLIDLKSKAKTFKNGVALENDHVGVQIETNDIISLGTSTRQYLLEIDNTGILDYLQRRSRELRKEIAMLEDDFDPSSLNKSANRLFIGGLAYNTSRYDICELFGPIGPIVDVSLPQIDRSISNDAEDAFAVRGIAFIEFADKKDARTALELSGRHLCGRPITVNYANLTKEERAVQNALLGEEKCLSSFVPATSKTFEHPTQRALQGVNLDLSAEGDTKKRSRWDLHDDRTEKNYGADESRFVGEGLRSEKEAQRELFVAAGREAVPSGNSNSASGFSGGPPEERERDERARAEAEEERQRRQREDEQASGSDGEERGRRDREGERRSRRGREDEPKKKREKEESHRRREKSRREDSEERGDREERKKRKGESSSKDERRHHSGHTGDTGEAGRGSSGKEREESEQDEKNRGSRNRKKERRHSSQE
ncbi:putative RNA recognition motif-containing protein [Neospora caninum Liverpool]|uniref:Putative RNA recognition motif-containing protein n=1 Tax=Neospora caninum (strain Liverpool) TaxID=572307 RepID=F0VAM8_NEOCL|nr:putative RNA recognition motif-containing protein [Neospora caninum Liverpool]CBZ50783.1 putative RNA recognition motif-containing protein [Neospora caninum Liverpool]CEL68084.1 TPA: RNA recognition motif-containing protein,putative [Neospora caninum Liverpool]|eukprot:XP_003880816.1 putative RNA recognition motif-containing protein [Neospora caninum Liverpool]